MVIRLTKKVIKVIGRQLCILNIKAVQFNLYFSQTFLIKYIEVCVYTYIYICIYMYTYVSGYRVYKCTLNKTKTIFLVEFSKRS